MTGFGPQVLRGLLSLTALVCLAACGSPSADSEAPLVPGGSRVTDSSSPAPETAAATESESTGSRSGGARGSGEIDDLARFPLFVTPAGLGMGVEVEECGPAADPFSACI